MSTSVMWFRRDLRLADNPALLAARDSGDEVLGVFVLDPRLMRTGGHRTARLLASVADLKDRTDGALVVREGDPVDVIPAIAAEVEADSVHISAESTPYGRARDRRVHAALAAADRRLVATGSPYAVGPGTLTTGGGTRYKVFTPYSRAWRDHGWPAPAPQPRVVRWCRSVRGDDLPSERPGRDEVGGVGGVGEASARRRWRAFRDRDLSSYDGNRDRPDLDRTSRLSAHLKYGELHPRTLLADLDEQDLQRTRGGQRFVTELAWREFYADVLWHEPESAWHDLRPLEHLSYDSGTHAEELVEAWRQGRTGYPMVDAGMRQLLAEGWMHNRVRMLTASFLVKDLHVWWPVGARHFLEHLLDGDIASNNHGWQWVAGTGTDAAPYFRIFNPVLQGKKFDPDGQYVRRWIPELGHLDGVAAHEPWKHDDGYRRGYPHRVVDHDEERRLSLSRYRGESG